MKLVLLKFSVGLIVLQGIVEQLMVTTSTEPYTDDSTWSREDKTIRGYCEFLYTIHSFRVESFSFNYRLLGSS